MQTNSLMTNGLLGQSSEHEHIDRGQREADKRQDQTEEKETRQRILPAKARPP